MLPGLIAFAVLLAGVAVYFWWQRRPLAPGALTRRAPFARLMGLRRSTVFALLVVLVILCVGSVYLVGSVWKARSGKQAQKTQTPPPPAAGSPSAAFLDKFPKDYPSVYAPPTPPASKPPPELPPKGVPVTPPSSGVAQAQTPPPPPLTKTDLEGILARTLAQHQDAQDTRTAQMIAQALAQYERTHPQVPPQQVVVPPGQGQAPPQPQAQAQPKTSYWDTSTDSFTLGARFKKGHEDKGEKKSALFPQAVWETPARPERVIYDSQLIHGMLEQAIVTGEATTIRIKTTETLYDRFFQQTELIPMDSTFLMTVDASVRRGQNRVHTKVTKVSLPDGTDLALVGNAGSPDGAAGIPGKVNNHYPEVLFGAFISTMLGVAPRVLAGNTQGYNPTVPQQIATEVSSSGTQTGQQIVREMFNIPPTISVPPQIPVTIQLATNVSLQTPPVIIHK
jgi:type IV secretion system protein TrbI